MLLWINQQTTTSWLSNFVVTMFLKKVVLIKSSLFDKFKRDNFWAPFLKASEVTTKNGGGEGSISILVGNPYCRTLPLLIGSSLHFFFTGIQVFTSGKLQALYVPKEPLNDGDLKHGCRIYSAGSEDLIEHRNTRKDDLVITNTRNNLRAIPTPITCHMIHTAIQMSTYQD